MQVHWTTHLKQKWYRNPAKSVKTLIARQRDSYIHHETGTKNHNGWLNLRLSNLMLGHWLKRCYLMCKEMHGHSAAKRYHCLSRRFLRTSENWKQKSSERHDPQQINLMQGHWLKRYQMKWNEMHRQSAAKKHHCLSNRFLRTPQNWKQKSSETRSTKKINLMQPHWTTHFKQKGNRIHT